MNQPTRSGIFAANASLGLFLLASGLAARPTMARAQASSTLAVDAPKDVARSLEGSFMRVADSVGPATVLITSNITGTAGNDPRYGESDPFSDSSLSRPPASIVKEVGSGVIIRADGYILTNDHVVEAAVNRRVKVILSDNSTYVGIVFRDTASDLAIVKIEAGKPLPCVAIGDSSHVRVGQWAIAVGSPFEEQNTVTAGIVSALHRSSEIADDQRRRYYFDLIQTDAPINPGNSGGPLLNIDGQLIGVVVALQSAGGSSSGVGFAIPVNAAKAIADQLIAYGKVTRATLGITPTDIPAFLRQRLAISEGAYITEVTVDTPADKAGLEPGDVITQFAGADINSATTLRDAINATKPNVAVPITYFRGGKSKTVSAVLQRRDSPSVTDESPTDTAPSVPITTHKPTAADLGIIAGSLSTETLAEFDIKPTIRGLMVNNVSWGSPAAEAGLKRGSIITAINGVPINSLQGLNIDIAAMKPDDVVALTVYLPAGTYRSPGRGIINIIVP